MSTDETKPPTPMDPWDDRLVAHHEAGHAVVAAWLGFELGDMGLGQGPDDRPHIGYMRIDRGGNADQRKAELAMISLAGVAAQERFCPGAWNYGAILPDLSQALHLLGNLLLEDATLGPLIQQTKAIVDQCWPVVTTLASALVERRVLPHAEVAELLRAEMVKLGYLAPAAYVLSVGEFSGIVCSEAEATGTPPAA